MYVNAKMLIKNIYIYKKKEVSVKAVMLQIFNQLTFAGCCEILHVPFSCLFLDPFGIKQILLTSGPNDRMISQASIASISHMSVSNVTLH